MQYHRLNMKMKQEINACSMGLVSGTWDLFIMLAKKEGFSVQGWLYVWKLSTQLEYEALG